MLTPLRNLPVRWALGLILLATATLGFGATEDFDKIARQALAETHAKAFQAGDIKTCVAMYTRDAKLLVDNKLIATGETELLKFYRELRDVDQIRKIQIDKFVEIGSRENVGWAIFNYTKEYDLRGRDAEFLKRNKLEGFSTVFLQQYGTALFVKSDGQWKVQTMTVFDPEIWERKK